jgi:hypothetical protein
MDFGFVQSLLVHVSLRRINSRQFIALFYTEQKARLLITILTGDLLSSTYVATTSSTIHSIYSQRRIGFY